RCSIRLGRGQTGGVSVSIGRSEACLSKNLSCEAEPPSKRKYKQHVGATNSFRLRTLPDRKPEKLQAGLTAIRTGVSPKKSRGSVSSATVPAKTDGKELGSR